MSSSEDEAVSPVTGASGASQEVQELESESDGEIANVKKQERSAPMGKRGKVQEGRWCCP